MDFQFDPALLNSLSGITFKARYIMEGFLSGMHQSPFHGFSVEFSDYRVYQPGDDLRHLDWRLYARSDRLCIKRFEQETNVRFYLLVDSSASMSYRGEGAWGSKFECAQTVAMALAWLMLRQNDAVGLLAMEQEKESRTKELRPRYIAPSQKTEPAGAAAAPSPATAAHRRRAPAGAAHEGHADVPPAKRDHPFFRPARITGDDRTFV